MKQLRSTLRLTTPALALLALAAVGCNPCDGTRFRVDDGVTEFDVPGLGPAVRVHIPDITSQGASAQRALRFRVLEGDREIALATEVYEGQTVDFTYNGRRYGIEVLTYYEHLLNADEADLCLHAY